MVDYREFNLLSDPAELLGLTERFKLINGQRGVYGVVRRAEQTRMAAAG